MASSSACVDPPYVEHGHVAYSSMASANFGNGIHLGFATGKSITYECGDYYGLVGTATVTCTDTVWSTTLPECRYTRGTEAWFWTLIAIFIVTVILIVIILIFLCCYFCRCCKRCGKGSKTGHGDEGGRGRSRRNSDHSDDEGRRKKKEKDKKRKSSLSRSRSRSRDRSSDKHVLV